MSYRVIWKSLLLPASAKCPGQAAGVRPRECPSPVPCPCPGHPSCFCSHLLSHGGQMDSPSHLATRRRHPSFSIAPQASKGQGWGGCLGQAVLGSLQQLIAISGPPWIALQQPSSLPLCPEVSPRWLTPSSVLLLLLAASPDITVGPLTCSLVATLQKRSQSSRS